MCFVWFEAMATRPKRFSLHHCVDNRSSDLTIYNPALRYSKHVVAEWSQQVNKSVIMIESIKPGRHMTIFSVLARQNRPLKHYFCAKALWLITAPKLRCIADEKWTPHTVLVSCVPWVTRLQRTYVESKVVALSKQEFPWHTPVWEMGQSSQAGRECSSTQPATASTYTTPSRRWKHLIRPHLTGGSRRRIARRIRCPARDLKKQSQTKASRCYESSVCERNVKFPEFNLLDSNV